MKVGGLLVLGVLGGGAYYYFKSAKKVSNLSISLAGLKLDSKATNISETVFNCNLAVYNPGTQDVKFTSFIGNVFTEDGKTRLANIDTAASVAKIAARSTTNIPVRFVISNSAALQQFIPTIAVLLGFTGGEATLPQAFIIQGTLKAENLPAIPITQKMKLSL
jgi:hypothetical protein